MTTEAAGDAIDKAFMELNRCIRADAGLGPFDEAHAILSRLVQAVREECEEDTVRLDWMEANRGSLEWGGILERRKGFDARAVGIEWVLPNGDILWLSDRYARVREAIDAARALASKTAGGGKS